MYVYLYKYTYIDISTIPAYLFMRMLNTRRGGLELVNEYYRSGRLQRVLGPISLLQVMP